MSTQPTEVHRELSTKLVWQLCNLKFSTVGDAEKHTAQLLADSEARAVEAATKQLRSELNYAKASEELYHDEGTQLRERVRVLEEAAKPFIEYAKAYGACTGSELWAPNGTKLKPSDWLTLAATKEGTP